MPHVRQARFIVLEGLDGAGTTTQAERLASALGSPEQEILLTTEPSEGPLGHVLRQHLHQELTLDPVATALAFSADRADHLARAIRPALGRGTDVVCDRYLLSTLAYQGAEHVDRGWILAVSRSFEIPDLTVFLDVPESERRARLDVRGGSERYDDPTIATALRDSYLTSIELLREEGHRIEVVDGAAPVDAVTSTILDLLA